MDSFDEYQEQVAEHAMYPADEGPPGLYPALGLTGEAGEVAEKIKKFWRDGGDQETTRTGVKKELGDVLWYLSEVARRWDLKLSEIAESNIDKIVDRRIRGVLHGAGDNR